MDLNTQRQPLDAPGIPDVDGELAIQEGSDGGVRVEVIEHLRVKVPAAARLAWLEAERASWEPWLRSQVGFLGRELRWDQEREEGQLLIRWASRSLWHAIPRQEIEQVQERFERLAHAALERLGVVEELDGPVSLESESTPRLPPATASTDAHHAGLSSCADAADKPSPGAGAAAATRARPANPFPLVYSGELTPEALP